jgi:hypothetical protein
MKGKRYTTGDKIRILREADAGKSILEVSNLPSTLHSNVSPIAGIATDGFVAVLGARIRLPELAEEI